MESMYKRESKYNLTVSDIGELDPSVNENVTGPMAGARTHPDHLANTRAYKQFEFKKIFPRNWEGSVEVLHICTGNVEDL
jgi:hypothetical protein